MKAFRLLILSAGLAWPQNPGVREVKYEVDGTAGYATLTTTNAQGGKEQHLVLLPFETHFYASPGSFLYLSAQKTRVANHGTIVANGASGTVHVLIRVGGKVLQEASSSAPFGIATADGKVPD
jgi:hypothetical protein